MLFNFLFCGYGFLWNNLVIGCVVFGKNVIIYEVYVICLLDYWVVVGDILVEILELYIVVIGWVLKMLEYGLGFW